MFPGEHVSADSHLDRSLTFNSSDVSLKIIQNMKADKFAVLSPRRMSCLYIVYISLKNHIKFGAPGRILSTLRHSELIFK